MRALLDRLCLAWLRKRGYYAYVPWEVATATLSTTLTTTTDLSWLNNPRSVKE